MNQLQRPTGIRFGMIAITTLVAVMLYLDRVCLSIVGSDIRENLKFTEIEFARLLSAFFWAYAFCQIPAGWIGDRFGPRIVLAIYLFFWSLCTGLMGMVSGFTVFLFLRMGCGLFEAGAYPLANGIVRRWVPLSGRGLASGCVAVGGRLGGAIAPMLTTYLAAGAVDGWRKPFILYGVVGMVGAVVFWFWYRDWPDQHPAINQGEIDLINGNNGTPDVSKPSFPDLGALASSWSLWLASLVQVLSNFAWVFLVTLLPSYLEEVFKTPKETRALYQALPLYFGIAGMFFGGWVTDRCFRNMGPKWGRALPMAASRIVVGLAYLVCLKLGDAFLVTMMMCVVAMATDMGNPAFWAWCQDVGGKHVGSVVGWGNMWGNIGAALAPEVFILVKSMYPADPMMGWNAVFLMCALVQVVGALAAMGIDATKPIQVDKVKTI
ncbi:MAG: MFS transporter [Gemmataceae bacterium]